MDISCCGLFASVVEIRITRWVYEVPSEARNLGGANEAVKPHVVRPSPRALGVRGEAEKVASPPNYCRSFFNNLRIQNSKITPISPK